MINWIVSRLFVGTNKIFVFFLTLPFFLLFFKIIYKVFSLNCLIILSLIKNGFFLKVNWRKWFTLEGLIDFFAHKLKHLRFVILLIEKDIALSHIFKNIAVMGLFIFVFNVGENFWTFLGGDRNILLLFKNSFNFFVFELFFSVGVSLHNVGDSFDMEFRVIFMELVILNDGFVFIVVLRERIDSAHEFFLLIGNGHLSEYNCLFAELIVNYVVHVLQIINVLSVKVFMVQGVVYKNLKGGLCT